MKVLRDGTREFEIKWKGYSVKETTWEPEANLQCKDLLSAFLAKVDNVINNTFENIF